MPKSPTNATTVVSQHPWGLTCGSTWEALQMRSMQLWGKSESNIKDALWGVSEECA